MHGARPEKIRDLTDIGVPSNSFGVLQPETPTPSVPAKKKINVKTLTPTTLKKGKVAHKSKLPLPVPKAAIIDGHRDNVALPSLSKDVNNEKIIYNKDLQKETILPEISIPSSSKSIPKIHSFAIQQRPIVQLVNETDKNGHQSQSRTGSAPPFFPYPRPCAPHKTYPSEMGRNVLAPYVQSPFPPRVDIEANRSPFSSIKNKVVLPKIFGRKDETASPEDDHELSDIAPSKDNNGNKETNVGAVVEGDTVHFGTTEGDDYAQVAPGEGNPTQNANHLSPRGWKSVLPKLMQWKSVPLCGVVQDGEDNNTEDLVSEPGPGATENNEPIQGPSQPQEEADQTEITQNLAGDPDTPISNTHAVAQDVDENQNIDQVRGMADTVLNMVNIRKVTGRMAALAELKRNMFLEPMQRNQIINNIGACQFFSPFWIMENIGEFHLQTNIIHQVISILLIVGLIVLQSHRAYSFWPEVQLKGKPMTGAKLANETMIAVVMCAYLYAVTIKRSVFGKMFGQFKVTSEGAARAVSQRKNRLVICLALTALGFLSLIAWIQGGSLIFYDQFETLKQQLYVDGIKYGFPECPGESCKSEIIAAAFIINLLKKMLIFHIDLTMCGGSGALFTIQKTTKNAVCRRRHGTFDLDTAIDIYKSVKEQIHTVSDALGPITFSCVVQLVPLTVLTLDSMSKGQLQWYELALIMVRVGHIVLSAESSARGDALGDKVLTDYVEYKPGNAEKIAEITNLARQPIALWGMGFFKLSYVILGGIFMYVITYFGLGIELSPDDKMDKLLESIHNNTILILELQQALKH